MNRLSLIPFLVLIGGMGVLPFAHAEALPRQDPSQTEWAVSMVRAHNHYRDQVGVAGLSWSSRLADYAQEWADTLAADGCQMRHRTNHLYGENLYWQSAIMWSDGRRELAVVTPEEVVDSWASEMKDYDAISNQCMAGAVCGHYTQVVWRATREVGCAMSPCPDHGQIWVCNYHPHGNIVGQRPHP